MAIYTDSKEIQESVAVPGAVDALPFGRVEPLLSPEQLKHRYLFGIPLWSAKDPVSGARQEMTDAILADHIEGAINSVEAELKITIMPVQRRERMEYDAHHFKSYMYFRVNKPPIMSIDSLVIQSANGDSLYQIPKEWIETGNFISGQINMVPLAIATVTGGGGGVVGGIGGLFFLSHAGRAGWVPAYWTIHYTAGFPDGKVPRIVNDLIGINAAIEVLSMLAANNRETSSSLGLDGISRGTGTPGPQIHAQRIQDLQQKKSEIIGKVQAMFGKKFIVSDV